VCGQQHVSPLFIHGKSRMRKSARTDLRGGRSAMVVPTATTEPKRFFSNTIFGIDKMVSTFNGLLGAKRLLIMFLAHLSNVRVELNPWGNS
jgi:hypothetical protein